MVGDTPPNEMVKEASQLVGVLHQMGFSDEQIFEGVPEGAKGAESPAEAIAQYAPLRIASGDTLASADVKNDILQDVIVGSEFGIKVGSGFHYKQYLENHINRALSVFGFGFKFESIGSSDWVEPESQHHPRAFRLVITDDTNEQVTRSAFRYPPWNARRHPATLIPALATGLNETVLKDVNLSILFLDEGSDMFKLFIVDRGKFEELKIRYGESLEIFGEPLIRPGPLYGWDWSGVDRSVATDHAEEFGVPEPGETYKIEEQYGL